MSRRDRYRAAPPSPIVPAEPEPIAAEAPPGESVEEIVDAQPRPEEPSSEAVEASLPARPGWARCRVISPLLCNGVEYAEGDVSDFPVDIADNCTALTREG